MSQYVEFYLRVGDRFAPILTRSRSTNLYQMVSHSVPYEGIRALDRDDIREFIEDARAEIHRIEGNIARQQKQLAMIPDFENTVDEKLQAIGETQDYIEELEQELDYAKGDLAFFNMLDDMWEEAEQTKWYKDEHPEGVIDPDRYIYAGVECGFPTLEDIKGGDEK